MRTDEAVAEMTKLLVDFRNFAKAPKKAELFDKLVHQQCLQQTSRSCW
jgi:hypothetical protein